jgi:hypothetical protein
VNPSLPAAVNQHPYFITMSMRRHPVPLPCHTLANHPKPCVSHALWRCAATQPRGRVHLLVDYQPRGLAPQHGDVVYLESHARWPGAVVLPRGEPLVVADTRCAVVAITYCIHILSACVYLNSISLSLADARCAPWQSHVHILSTRVYL